MDLGLRNKDLKTITEVITHYPAAKEVLIYGSRAEKTYKRASDIDLAIIAPALHSAKWTHLRDELEEAPLIYELDIAPLDSLPDSDFKYKVLSEGITMYEKTI